LGRLNIHGKPMAIDSDHLKGGVAIDSEYSEGEILTPRKSAQPQIILLAAPLQTIIEVPGANLIKHQPKK
jgi:hypothetical protein